MKTHIKKNFWKKKDTSPQEKSPNNTTPLSVQSSETEASPAGGLLRHRGIQG